VKQDRALWAKLRELERRLNLIEDEKLPPEPVEPVAVAVAGLTELHSEPRNRQTQPACQGVVCPGAMDAAAGGEAVRASDGGKATAQRARGSLEPEPERYLSFP